MGTLNNTHILCFILGWQGGTIYQVATALDINATIILTADEAVMGELCRKAQQVQWDWQIQGLNALTLKHLNVCVTALVKDYDGRPIPPWLERAQHVAKILSEP